MFDQGALSEVLQDSAEKGCSFSINVHGTGSLAVAIDKAEKLLGGPSEKVTITQQPSCFVVTAKRDAFDVAFFVSKNADTILG
jgi:hypothetical protein